MNGYSLRTNHPFGDEYIKNNTVLQFSDVQESTTYDPSTDEYIFNGYILTFMLSLSKRNIFCFYF